MLNRKTHKSPITKQMFWEIKRTIRAALAAGNYDAHRIALENGVSDETVRAVRRVGTWPKYEEVKRARNLARGRTHETPVPPIEPASPGQSVDASPLAEKTMTISVGDYNSLIDERNRYRAAHTSISKKYNDLKKRRFVLRLGRS